MGHLLQGRFKSLLVEKESYLLELCRYVVLNPVRAGLVPTADDWAWSSYRETVGLEAVPAWLDVPCVLTLFDGDAAMARRAYAQFVIDGVSEPSPWSHVTGQIFLGSPAFLERMERQLEGQSMTNVPASQTRPTRPSPDDVLGHVAASYGVPLSAVLSRSHHDAYQTAVYLLRRAANEPLQTVAIRVGVSPSRISKIQRTIDQAPLTPLQKQAFAQCKVKN